MDFETFKNFVNVDKHKSILVIFDNGRSGTLTKNSKLETKNLKKIKVNYYNFKYKNDTIEDTSLKKIFDKFESSINKLQAYDAYEKMINSSEFKQPEKPKESVFEWPLYSNEAQLSKPKIHVDSLLPNVEWTDMMKNLKIKKELKARMFEERTRPLIRSNPRTYYRYSNLPDLSNQEIIQRFNALSDLYNQELPVPITVKEYINKLESSDKELLSHVELQFRDIDTVKRLLDTLKKLPKPKYSSFEIPNEPCSICYTDMEPSESICKLQCGHIFHCDCINRWLREPLSNYGYHIKSTCPYCRKPVESIETNQKETSFGFLSDLGYLLKLKCK